MSELTHLDAEGHAHMVDVGEKHVTRREAVARGTVLMQPATLQLIMAGGLPKGDVLAGERAGGGTGAPTAAPLFFPCPSVVRPPVAAVIPTRPAAAGGAGGD